MIISASRRTDIPAYYSDWFFRRLCEGFVYIRNPMSPRMISKISLSPETVDGIVFWTKNPAPMLDRLCELRDYTFYFQFTLNPYDTDIEQNLPSKNDFLIPTFQRLSAEIGRERIVWRYDPILLSEKYTVQYHIDAFRELCSKLSGCTEKCTVSFIDIYRSIERRIHTLGISPPDIWQTEELMGAFSCIAKEHGIYIDTCAEAADLSRFDIGHASCIDTRRLERIGNFKLTAQHDKNQRAGCGCMESIDIGAYNTCRNGCVYCYANHSPTAVDSSNSRYDPASPLLCSKVTADDIIKPREIRSCRMMQMDIFDLPQNQ